MVYNIRSLAKRYAQGQLDFLRRKRLTSWSGEDAYTLFAYALDRIYDLDSVNYNAKVAKHGDACVEYLKGLKRTPKHINRVLIEDRVAVVSMAKAYFVLLYNKGVNINNSELPESVGFSTGEFDVEEEE